MITKEFEAAEAFLHVACHSFEILWVIEEKHDVIHQETVVLQHRYPVVERDSKAEQVALIVIILASTATQACFDLSDCFEGFPEASHHTAAFQASIDFKSFLLWAYRGKTHHFDCNGVSEAEGHRDKQQFTAKFHAAFGTSSRPKRPTVDRGIDSLVTG